jgi:hypothetical protein
MKQISRKTITKVSLAVAVASAMSFGCVAAQQGPPGAAPGAAPQAAPVVAPTGPNDPAKMSFFVTSTAPGGGDLGGIAGADAHCTTLARAAGSPVTRTWRAYLSLAPMGNQPQVDARDRIGKGPWYNAKGVGDRDAGQARRHELEQRHLRRRVLHRDAIRSIVDVSDAPLEADGLRIVSVRDEDLLAEGQRSTESLARNRDSLRVLLVASLDQLGRCGGSSVGVGHRRRLRARGVGISPQAMPATGTAPQP